MGQNNSLLTRPIFLVGMPRSGTTILFEAIDRHEDLGWISNYSDRFPKWPLFNILCRLLDNDIILCRGQKKQYQHTSMLNRFLPRSEEAYGFWDYYTEVDFSYSFLSGERATDSSAKRIRNTIQKTLWLQGKKRFAAKLTGPGRIHFIRSIFPDALFIHVIRDGRAIVHSLMNVKFWRENGGHDKPYWNWLPENTKALWDAAGRDPIVLASLEWRLIVESIRLESAELEKDSYLEVRYEDFISASKETARNILKFCGLAVSPRINRFLTQMKYAQHMNEKYASAMPLDTVATMESIMHSLLKDLGYGVCD